MDINGIGSSFGGLSELMANRKVPGAEVQPEAEGIVAKIAQPEAQDKGIMSRNFVSSEGSSVKNYAEAEMKGKRAMAAQDNRQNAILNSAMAETANATTNAERTLAGKRAARRLIQEMQQSIMEVSARNLEESRKNMRTAVERATQGEQEAAAQGTASAASTPAVAPSSDTGGESAVEGATQGEQATTAQGAAVAATVSVPSAAPSSDTGGASAPSGRGGSVAGVSVDIEV